MNNIYLTINDTKYLVVIGGTKCSDCTIKDLCMTNSLPKGITFDCTSVHLVVVLKVDKTTDYYTMTDKEAKEFYEDMEADYWIEQHKSGMMDIVEP